MKGILKPVWSVKGRKICRERKKCKISKYEKKKVGILKYKADLNKWDIAVSNSTHTLQSSF